MGTLGIGLLTRGHVFSLVVVGWGGFFFPV